MTHICPPISIGIIADFFFILWVLQANQIMLACFSLRIILSLSLFLTEFMRFKFNQSTSLVVVFITTLRYKVIMRHCHFRIKFCILFMYMKIILALSTKRNLMYCFFSLLLFITKRREFSFAVCIFDWSQVKQSL